MKQLTYTAILLLATNLVMAQAKITGTVKTSNQSPLANATISVLNSTQSTITDNNGNFSLTLRNGSYTIEASTVGYATQTQTVNIGNGKQTNINFILTEQSKQLDDVVVSSEKREAKLQKTPVAITVLSAQQLKNYRIWDVRDLTAVVPDLFVIEHAGSTGANFVNVRGIMGFTPEQSVATYIDGVYQFDYWSAPSPYNNIDRVEILRGPQGTLYGRNSLAGVINVITKMPTDATTGQVELNVGNYGQQRYSAVINTPIVKKKLFLGADIMYSQRGAVFTDKGKGYDPQYGQAFNVTLK